MVAQPQLPGFYFDEEKGKYFRIQADHHLPPNAKHARGNVVKEERAKKRQTKPFQRKRNEKKEANGPPPIKRTVVLQDRTIASTTFARECGLRTRYPTVADANAALARNSRLRAPCHVEEAVTRAIPQPHDERIVFVGRDKLRVRRWHDDMNQLTRNESDIDQYHIVALSGNAPMTCSPGKQPSTLYTAAWQQNLFWIVKYNLEGGDPLQRASAFAAMRARDQDERSLLAIEVSPSETNIATSIGQEVVLVDLHRQALSHSWEVANGARSVSWLNDRTLAASDQKSVRLWDTRYYDDKGVRRFTTQSLATGIKTLNEHQLLVADNSACSVFDLRWTATKAAQPALRFPVRQELAQAMMGVNEQGVVALYGEQCISLLSPREGSVLKTVDFRGSQRGNVISDLSWWEDSRGTPYVQMCVGAEIHRLSPWAS